jgi:hypothetical protein
MIIHTAHEFKAAAEHFRRVRDVVTGYDELRKRVVRHHVPRRRGDRAAADPDADLGPAEDGPQAGVAARFLARSCPAGVHRRLRVYGEAMILSDEQVGASMPTMSAVPNPR